MKKTQLLLFFLLLAMVAGYSQQRSEADAVKIANEFLQTSNLSLRSSTQNDKSISLSYKCIAEVNLRSANENAYYYVFNVNTDKGFVIVSGDERAKDILGYSENGGFDINTIPANLRYWLSCYKEELEILAKQPVSETPTFSETVNIDAVRAAQSYATSISPLLGGIKWDQGEPYNNLCPIDKTTSDRSVVGCVATGMAQVMMYYKWPEKGTGSYTYQSANVDGNITADFGATTYDWTNMLETYSGSESDDQKNAVATLMYHCGVAVSMTYTSGESGANSYSIPNALSTYFGYDPNMKVYVRESYTKAEWMNFIKAELNTNRPILYSGRSSGGGHLFVCDGYDSKDRFHFNWGWSGSSNGYFEITALNPSSLGIGGGTGGGFNSSQAIFTGIQKPTGASDTSSYEIGSKGSLIIRETEIARDGKFTINSGATFGNYGVKTFNGNIYLLLTTEAKEIITGVVNFGSLTIAPGSTYTTNQVANVPIDGSVPNGKYRIYWGYYDSVAGIPGIAQTRNAAPAYVNVTITDDKITFSSPTEGLPVLTANSLEVLNTLYEGHTGQFKISVTNSGGEYLDSYIGVYMQNTLDGTSDFVAVDKYFIGSGETKEFILSDVVSLKPGNYAVALMYDPTNSGGTSLKSLGVIGGTIKDAPIVNTAKLELTAPISFPDKNNVTPNTFKLKVDIKNAGDYFDGEVLLYYNVEGASYAPSDYQTVILEPGEEKTIYFMQAPSVAFGTQRVATRYYHSLAQDWLKYQGAASLVEYTFKDDISVGVEDEQIKAVGNISVYPNPATDYVSFESDEVVKSVRIVSLTGQVVLALNPATSGVVTIPVTDISAGTYIIQVETIVDVKTSKFIKK